MDQHDENKDWGADKGEEHPKMTRSGEELSNTEQEPGRMDTGTQGESERPTGTSSARDWTGVDPQEPAHGGNPEAMREES